MKYIACRDYDEMSRQAGAALIGDIRRFPRQVLCTATGNSCLGLYQWLATRHKEDPSLFKQLGIVKLDEWGGMDETDPASCEAYLRTHVTGPLQISEDRYIGFSNRNPSPEKECERIDQALARHGGIGSCILGLGVNGHIGFNEPADFLVAGSHKASLSRSSKMHGMLQKSNGSPEFGLTLGMGTIMRSRKVILLLSGDGKHAVIEELLQGRISTRLPASFLWMHPDVTFLRDMESTG